MITTAEKLSAVDFDLHGTVGLRLIDASDSDVAAVERQLGPIRRPLARRPDITLRFVPRLEPPPGARILGAHEAAFTDRTFYVTVGKHKSRTCVAIPFERLGRPCEVVCRSGLSAVPLLVAMVNLAALGRGVLPLHAAAFRYNGLGVLATGWSKGGKTESLLAFANRGAQHIGDEWVYLDAANRRMHGVAEPIRVWDWHLAHLPKYRAAIGRRARRRLWMVRRLESLVRRGPWGGKFIRRLAATIQRQRFVDVPPGQLFGPDALLDESPIDVALFVASHEAPQVRVAPIGADELARRMVASLDYERSGLLAYWRMFQFAFPGATNDMIDEAPQQFDRLLRRALEGKPALAVFHPYPVEIPRLFEALAPIVDQLRSAGAVNDEPLPAREPTHRSSLAK